MGCFPVDFQEAKRPLRTRSVKRSIEVGKRPINERKRPVKAKVLVGVPVACLMGCFRAPPPWRKTAPLKRPIKRSMKLKRCLAGSVLGRVQGKMGDRFLYSTPQYEWCIKIRLLWAQKFYTPLVLGGRDFFRTFCRKAPVTPANGQRYRSTRCKNLPFQVWCVFGCSLYPLTAVRVL